MTAEHLATSSSLIDELVADAVAFVREAEPSALAHLGADRTDIVRATLYEVWTSMQDHLQLKFAATIAAHQLLGGDS